MIIILLTIQVFEYILLIHKNETKFIYFRNDSSNINTNYYNYATFFYLKYTFIQNIITAYYKSQMFYHKF